VQYQTALIELCEREDRPLLASHWQTLIAGRSITLSVRFRSHNQERKWVQIACVPVLDKALGVVSITGCVAALSIQPNVEHEATANHTGALEKVRTSESRLLTLIENAPIGILVFDQNRTPSFVNKTWFQMTGHPSVSVKSIDVRSIVFPEDVSEFEARLEEVSKTRKPASIHIRLKSLHKRDSNTQEHMWVRFDAFPDMLDNHSFQITTIIVDISEFKYSEARQSEKLEKAVEARRQQEKYVILYSRLH
jgi:PAS domain S-box-containing protein